MKILRICIAAALLLLIFPVFFPAPFLFPGKARKSGDSAVCGGFSAADCCGEGEGPERAAVVDDNGQALLLRLKMAREARSELCYSTFDFRADASGGDLMAAFLAAAERGVKVRILIDGINGWLRLFFSREIRALAAHPNVEVKEYNPVRPFRLRKIHFRMHDKYMIADGSVYLLGGRNTNDLFLGRGQASQNTDRELLVFEARPGPDSSLSQLRRYFESMWSLPVCRRSFRLPAGAAARAALEKRAETLPQRYPELASMPGWSAATVPAGRITLLSGPKGACGKKSILWCQLLRLMRGGGELLAETPYIICSGEMYRGLSTLRQSSGGLTIITNSAERGANVVGCAEYLLHQRRVRATGADIREYSGPRSNHTKSILIGGRLSVIGSFNFDMRSALLDTELMAAVDSAALNKALREEAARRLECCRSVQPDGSSLCGKDFREIPFPAWKRLLYCFLGVVQLPFRHLL